MGGSSSSSPSFHSIELGAGRVFAAHAGAEEVEAHRLADDDAELVGGEAGRGALLHAERGEAEGGDGGLEAGDGGHGALNPHVVGAGRPAADADAAAVAGQAVGGGAARHGEVEIGAAEHTYVRGAVLVEPGVERAEEPIAQGGALHHAAVEEDGGGVEQPWRPSPASPWRGAATKPSSLAVAPA